MAIFGAFQSIKLCNKLNVFYAFHFIHFWHFILNVMNKIILIILWFKFVSWFKSNLREIDICKSHVDFCTSSKQLVVEQQFADKKKKRRRKASSACDCGRDKQARKVVWKRRSVQQTCTESRFCFRKIAQLSPPSFIQFSIKMTARPPRLDLRPIYAQIYSHSFHNTCL